MLSLALLRSHLLTIQTINHTQVQALHDKLSVLLSQDSSDIAHGIIEFLLLKDEMEKYDSESFYFRRTFSSRQQQSVIYCHLGVTMWTNHVTSFCRLSLSHLQHSYFYMFTHFSSYRRHVHGLFCPVMT